MPLISTWRERIHHALDTARARLASQEGVLTLAFLGLLSGIFTGAIILVFRLLIEWAQGQFLPGGGSENYEHLSTAARLILCIIGGLAVGILLQAIPSGARRIGVVHVMERLAYHQAHIPIANALAQFFGAAISIISGHSVGREGPSIHLGATSGSVLGVSLNLPNNTVRILAACGIAASIAASFNTPLAGVIFAMEVVLMEYTLSGFTPVILAAVSGTTITRIVYGNMPAFSVPDFALGSLAELPMVVITGIVIGTLAAIFTRSLLFFSRQVTDWPIWMRTTLAGSLTGIAALAVPEIMGIGYDTVNAALLGEIGLTALIIVSLVKLFVTTAGLGLGLPGGLIGPTLVVGATAGGALGMAAEMLLPDNLSPTGFYALLGMGAMMAAALQAPLAGLTAMLELTSNPNVILPGMLALVTANLVTRQLYRTDSVFLMMMRATGLDYRNDPIAQSLRRIGVNAAMSKRVTLLQQRVGLQEAHAALTEEPRWVIVREDTKPVAVLAAADLARALEEDPGSETLDLLQIPADRREVAPIALEATLQEALETLQSTGAGVLYVTRPAAPGIPHIYGVLTQEAIEESYRY